MVHADYDLDEGGFAPFLLFFSFFPPPFLRLDDGMMGLDRYPQCNGWARGIHYIRFVEPEPESESGIHLGEEERRIE